MGLHALHHLCLIGEESGQCTVLFLRLFQASSLNLLPLLLPYLFHLRRRSEGMLMLRTHLEGPAFTQNSSQATSRLRSFLQVTKRPKLRSKDLAHRQSFVSNVPDMYQARSPAEQSSSADGYPVPANLYNIVTSLLLSDSLGMIPLLLSLPNFF